MNAGWSDEELKACVAAYLEMQRDERLGQPYLKRYYYARLAQAYGRGEEAYERGMRDVSYVLALMGRSWQADLRPLPDTAIDAAVAARIERIAGEILKQKAPPLAALKIAVRDALRRQGENAPRGHHSPRPRRVTITRFRCDAAVHAWVLRQAGGMCEGCERDAPFRDIDGQPYLRLHHMRPLADGGSDTPSNAVALCPNCHHEIRYGASAHALAAWLYDNVDRLIPE